MTKRKKTNPHPDPIRNQDAIVDAVTTVMHELDRDGSIDKLLTRPFDAMRLGLSIASQTGSIDEQLAKEIRGKIDRIEDRHANVIVQVNNVCRAALNARKRGSLNKGRN